MANKIAPDKWKHFFVGIVMGLVLQGFASFLLKDHLAIATCIAFGLVLAISYGFELFSKFTGMGHYDFIDAVAGALGGVLGMALMLFATVYVFH
jgi:VanZ family protein